MAGNNQLKSLEENLNMLENLVRSLDDNSLKIDEVIERYSTGMKLAVECRKSLGEMNQRVSVVRQEAMNEISKLERSEMNQMNPNQQGMPPQRMDNDPQSY